MVSISLRAQAKLSHTIRCTHIQYVCIFHICIQKEACEIEELPRAVAVPATPFKCRMRNFGHVLVRSLKLAFPKGKWRGLSTSSQHLTALEYLATVKLRSVQVQLAWGLLQQLLCLRCSVKLSPHMLKHINNSVGSINLNLAVKLVSSIVAACPLSRSDSGSLTSFQPSYITEAESQNLKNWSPDLQFYQFTSGAEDFRPAPSSHTATLPKAACTCYPELWGNNPFSSLTENTFLVIHFIYFVRFTEGEAALCVGGHKASLCQRWLRAHAPAHWPVLFLPGTFSWAIYKSSEIRKNK